MAREELCSIKRYEREKPRQHKKPGKSRHGVGRERTERMSVERITAVKRES